MPPVIVPIVEGQSEVESVPLLLRRLFQLIEAYSIEIRRPIRVKRQKIVKPGELERAVELAAMQQGCRAILVLVDADDDCPAELGPELLRRAQTARGDIPLRVVVAKSELESWFVGSIESLRGCRGISSEASAPENPEEIRDAKGWLTRLMPAGRAYLEVDDQPALTARFDIGQARRRCDSFDKFVRDVEDLVAAVAAQITD